MEENKPLVSVIMPAYNAEKYIEEAIMSVINQSYKNWQLLVIDDGSQDSTPAIVKALAEKDHRIQLHINEKNMGVAKTRNKGFDMAEGDYVALLDSDDIWLPEKLEKQIKLAQKSGAEIIYTSYEIIDTEGNKCKGDYIVKPVTNYKDLLEENNIGCSTMLLHKKICDIYRFNNEYAHEDYVFCLEILKYGHKAAGLTEVLSKYRFYIGSRSANKFIAAKNRWIVYRNYLKLPILKCVFVFFKYIIAGIKKYK